MYVCIEYYTFKEQHMKNVVKKTAALSTAALLLVCSAFADSPKSNSKKHMHSDKFAERPAHTDRNYVPAENSVLGDWILRENDKIVKAEFDRDGTMEITWKQGFTSEIEWKGSWTATDSEITFTVRSKETETWTNGTKRETREAVNAVWKIKYKLSGDTLTLTSSDLPKEVANGTVYNRDY